MLQRLKDKKKKSKNQKQNFFTVRVLKVFVVIVVFDFLLWKTSDMHRSRENNNVMICIQPLLFLESLKSRYHFHRWS